MDDRVIWAATAVAAGVLIGAGAGYLTRVIVAKRERRAHVEGLAAPAAAFVFWLVLAAGIGIAIAILAPDELQPLVEQTLTYLPNVLVAVLILIVGRAIAAIASGALGAGLAKATGRTRRQAGLALRVGILIVTVMLVLAQLGVNTVLLNMVAGAVLFGTSAALALLVGLGGRDVAKEIAAGRYLRRIFTTGDRIEAGDVSGHIVALHPATTELSTSASGTLHVPNTDLLNSAIRVEHPDGPDRP
jgi:small-conductance mechanosensitive channel